MNDHSDRLLTIREVATYLSVSEHTVRVLRELDTPASGSPCGKRSRVARSAGASPCSACQPFVAPQEVP